jgi:hypothetical protein
MDPPPAGGWLKLVTAKGKNLLEKVRDVTHDMCCEDDELAVTIVDRWNPKLSLRPCVSNLCALDHRKKIKDVTTSGYWSRIPSFGFMNAQMMEGSVPNPWRLVT